MSVVCKHTPNIVSVRVALCDFGVLFMALFWPRNILKVNRRRLEDQKLTVLFLSSHLSLYCAGFVGITKPCDSGRKDGTRNYIKGYLFKVNSGQLWEHLRVALRDSETSILQKGWELTDSVHVRQPCWRRWVAELLGASQDASRIGRQWLLETAQTVMQWSKKIVATSLLQLVYFRTMHNLHTWTF